MSKTEAHTLLDAARAGLAVSKKDITAALFATGDIGYRPLPANELPLSSIPEAA